MRHGAWRFGLSDRKHLELEQDAIMQGFMATIMLCCTYLEVGTGSALTDYAKHETENHRARSPVDILIG